MSFDAKSLKDAKYHFFNKTEALTISYYQRVRRQSKENKRSTISNYLAIPRTSQENKPKEQSSLLNKEQLFSIKSADHSYRTNPVQHLHTTHLPGKFHGTQNIFFSSRKSSPISTHNYSLQKVKNNLKAYQQLWQKDEISWSQKKGFPSILRNIQQERLRMEKKESISLYNLKDHMSYQMWADSLRNSKDIKAMFTHKTPGTKITKKMMVRGKNKQQSQNNWVNRKGNAGYQFKLLKQQELIKKQ